MYSTYYGSRQDGYGYNADMLREGFDLLEARADCLGWWSVARRVLRSYGHQPIIRLRRSSDSAERDFYGIGPQGEVSTADVRAWNGWNLLRHTEDFDNAVWLKQSGGTGIAPVVTQNAAVAPDGTTTADQVVFNKGAGATTADLSILNQTLTSFTATACGSIWLRSESPVKLMFRTAATWLQVDVTTSWQRFELATTGSHSGLQIGLRAGYAEAPAIPNSATVFLWAAQLERAASASAYEPRTTTSAGDSFLVTLYDQSGLARHFTQSTTTLQPIICEQGVPVTENGRLAAKFVAADARRMSIASSTAMFNALHTTGGTVLCVSKANDTAAFKTLIASRVDTTDAGFTFFRSSNENLGAGASRRDVAGVATTGNTMSVSASDTATTAQSIAVIITDPDNATAASRAFMWNNGTLSAAANIETATPFVENAARVMTLGATSAGGTPHDGTISEVAAFSDLISTADRTTYQSRSGNFYGVTIS